MSGYSGASASGRVLAHSAAAVPHTGDTNEFTFATITIPANSMGANGQVIVEAMFSYTNNANTKTVRIRFGGTAIYSQGLTTTNGVHTRYRVANRGAANSQVTTTTSLVGGFGTLAAVPLTLAIDTTADTTVTLTGQLGTSTDTVTLESYQVVLYPA